MTLDAVDPQPGVDVIIAVHSPERPIARAVRSVLEHNGEGVRLTVVCHNTDPEEIRSRLDAEHRDRVELLEHEDAFASASGPFNAGMDAATADYVAIMGSDDQLMPGAVSSWYWLARRTGADAVIARLELGERRAIVPTPPTRPFRRTGLDAVQDRLSYRSAPLGLVSREALTRLGLRLLEGAEVGGDVEFATRLWFNGRTAFDRSGPAYVIGEDAGDRVTYAQRPIARELRFLRQLLKRQWFRDMTLEQRRAACAKFIRIHLFGAVYNRRDPAFWTTEQRHDLARVAKKLLGVAPGVESVLSIADRRLLDQIVDEVGTTSQLLALAVARRRHGRPTTVLTSDPLRVFSREAPVRLMAASVLTRSTG